MTQEVDNKLVPVLTEAVGVVKMAVFKKLKEHFSKNYPDWEDAFANMMAGAIINDLFCTPNLDPHFVDFVRTNRPVIAQYVRSLATHEDFTPLLPHITDALRVSFMCDHNQGTDTSFILTRALQMGILMEERTIPLPRHFIDSVKILGDSLGLVSPPVLPPEQEDGEAEKKQKRQEKTNC
ncbi:hypothetical protein SAMN02745216_00073 [Desulfatibacillum alkenivorans DSM 16219]|jgi:hypothetical protein|uniref:Uncharacterized protein n=1 Tax=Desulfatibacillum alkenivorans DSM 16219 TaxID=1121393 RepID=A0A1M6BUG2_9BACT|nr:hypothetical protein [Desulfatibacillum alkenivorans]SHI52327.1 hypothetical protein SAMN02745216_00073 [Desulfatibacillum alkenivorans DSM 16219]